MQDSRELNGPPWQMIKIQCPSSRRRVTDLSRTCLIYSKSLIRQPVSLCVVYSVGFSKIKRRIKENNVGGFVAERI